jgi:hypothetical protein
MKKFGTVLLAALVLGACVVGEAGATFPTYWLSLQTNLTYAASATISLTGYNGGAGVGNAFGTTAGRFAFKRALDNNGSPGTVVDTYGDYFCADVAHAVNWNQWNKTELHILPPDYDPNGASELPTNVWLAGWVVEKYKAGWAGGTQGWGTGTAAQQLTYSYYTQLAVWEITHESNWSDPTKMASWWTGDLKAYNLTVTTQNAVKGILTDAAGQSLTPPLSHYLEYYQPTAGGQGMLRQDGEIPEPSSLLLVGTLLTGSALVALRRRRRG